MDGGQIFDISNVYRWLIRFAREDGSLSSSVRLMFCFFRVASSSSEVRAIDGRDSDQVSFQTHYHGNWQGENKGLKFVYMLHGVATITQTCIESAEVMATTRSDKRIRSVGRCMTYEWPEVLGE
jgi:hypothetical protein